MKPSSQNFQIDFSFPSDNTTLIVHFAGSWKLAEKLPSTDIVVHQIKSASSIKTIGFETSKISDWDTGLLIFVTRIMDFCKNSEIQVDQKGLPPGVQRLLALAGAVPERKGARKTEEKQSWLSRVGKTSIDIFNNTADMIHFTGEVTLAFMKMLAGRARFRGSDMVLTIQECGPNALPIVTLISILVGVILAFVGAIQLKMFGAQIYIADLVGLGMAREMGAMMAAIIMAGRTGSAYAAQLGSMQANEEIDALITLGISPMEFLVLPRMIALGLMMPLLCIYADLMGILGGAVVGIGMMDISPAAYFHQTRNAVALNHFAVGIFKSCVFGILVALSGCMRGMQCGRSASAVGIAATSAVVTAIVAIIVSDALLTILFSIIGI
ncbi:putative ABC transport system, permease protein, MlaE-like [Desulfonema limicola]|uniref:ABC transport system, permease protein, MlaE-like n=1 Tax=Desulfonema limicola TaxID=45656 RepID=A0A975BB29_9BACT|nr:ABC transporter permease [Desulfonema limicola]QTA81954.1 putative ABC transport system, permease protein, MlaE-like [Desulfonema limicola]